MPTALGESIPTTGLAPAISQGTSVRDSLAAVVTHSELIVRMEHRIPEPVAADPAGGTSYPNPGRRGPPPPSRLRTPGTTDGRFVVSGTYDRPRQLAQPSRSTSAVAQKPSIHAA